MFRRVIVVPAVLAAALLVPGCSGSSGDQPEDTKSSASVPSSAAPSYEGGEVKDVGCGTASGEGAATYAGPLTIHTGKVRGVLMMRKSTLGGVCNHVLWGAFEPASDSKGKYELSVRDETTGHEHTQPSAPTPTTGALTPGTVANIGDIVKVCVQAHGLRKVCLTEEFVG
jgi:hypothetical protein